MPTQVTDATFEAEVMKSTTPVLVDFWAPWCGPCKAMNPILEELDAEYAGKISFVKMNVDENMTVPGKYNVMSIPTFLLVKNGEVADSFVGMKSKEDVKVKLDALI